MTRFPRWFALCLLAVIACLAAGCAVSQTACDPRSAATPQAAEECRFSNLPNPDAKPSQTSWKIWGRFFTANKEGTVPVDPIPVRQLDKAALEALDPAANHIVRLGHSSHLLKLRGKLLYLVHNSTFDLAFHTWRDPLDRVAALSEKQGIALATPEIGEVLTLGQPRKNVLWWKSLR